MATNRIQTTDNQTFTTNFNFSTFCDWFLNISSQVVSHFHGDIFIDIASIMRKRQIKQPFSFFWGIRETGTWLSYPTEQGFTVDDFMSSLGARFIYFITFEYDRFDNDIITVTLVNAKDLIK